MQRRSDRDACRRMDWGTRDHAIRWPNTTAGARAMTLTATQPRPIYLAGRGACCRCRREMPSPAGAATPAGAAYNAPEDQYEEALQAAVKAFEETRRLPAYERGRALREISNGIKARREELGRLISLEAGKPIREAPVEVDRATLTFRLGAEEAERETGGERDRG